MPPRSEDEPSRFRPELLAELVGLTMAQAEARAVGFRVEDRTGPGWFTQAQDLRRIAVVLDANSLVMKATLG